MRLDAETIRAIRADMNAAREVGWSNTDFAGFFAERSIDNPTFKAALAGDDIADEIRLALVALSFAGFPPRLAPRLDVVRAHIEWHVAPARGAYDDALVEIAYDDGPDSGPRHARMFALDEIDQAATFAVERNLTGSNLYIGAALRSPDAPRHARGSQDNFYVGLAVPVDIDTEYDAVRGRMASAVEDGAVVVTGLTPERRSQHWVRLTEPCDDDLEFGSAFAALVLHTGADMKVKDSARIMRLAGTLSYPGEKKRAKGYTTELVALTINEAAKPVTIEALRALEPTVVVTEAWSGERPVSSGEVVRDDAGRVTDGREAHFRNLLLRELRKLQDEDGTDPSTDDLFAAAMTSFSDPAQVDNADGRWTGANGQKELRLRAENTLRRLRSGRLVRQGLFSIETGVGEAEARQVQAARDASFSTDFALFRSREIVVTDEPFLAPEGMFRASDLHGEPPERQWVVPDWIVEGAVNSLYGDGGLGKTLLAQQLACAVSTGASWLGMPTKRGPVLAVLCEDDKGELHRRHNAIKVAMGHLVGNPFEDVWLWPRVGDENVLVRWDKDNKATLGPFAELLMRTVRQSGVSLLILDTLADFYGGNEIDRSQVNYFVKTVLGGLIKERPPEHPLTVLLLGHPSQSGKASGSGYSGSTAWNAAVRSRMYLTRPEKDEDGGPDERFLVRGKANYARSGDMTTLRLHYVEGALSVEPAIPDDNSDMFLAMEETHRAVDLAWKRNTPYSAQKAHARFIYGVGLADIMRAGHTRVMASKAIRECIEQGKIEVGKSHGKRGYRPAND